MAGFYRGRWCPAYWLHWHHHTTTVRKRNMLRYNVNYIFLFFDFNTGLFVLETTCSEPDWLLEVGAVVIGCMVTSPIYSIYTKGLTPKLQIALCSPRPVQTLTGLRSFVLGPWCSWTQRTYECDVCPFTVFRLVMRQSATLRLTSPRKATPLWVVTQARKIARRGRGRSVGRRTDSSQQLQRTDRYISHWNTTI